jgi:dihydrofolate synthase / folylpolyglutamate synthase
VHEGVAALSITGAPAGSAETLLAPRVEQRIVPGLERITRVLELLGNPERRFPAVTVVGTNGKGSTAALLASVLRAHGLHVGLYTSPHLVRVEERIAVDGEPIAAPRLVELVEELARFPELSYFETLTVAAFLELAERGVDVAVLEAGLGGRWDAVNAAGPAVSLLTNVGTDHREWLGPTRTAIAAEKAAALKGHEAIVGTWDTQVEPVIRQEAAAPLSLAATWAEVTVAGPGRAGLGPRIDFAVGGISGSAVLPLDGEHQLANLRLALAGAAALERHGVIPALEASAIAEGITATRWPGRLQWLTRFGRRLLLDGAHNREAMTAVARTLDVQGLTGRIHLLFSCLDDKPLAAMAELLRPRVVTVVVAPIASPRATPVERLAAAFPHSARAGSVAEAVSLLPRDEPALVTGSLRLVGELLSTEETPHG